MVDAQADMPAVPEPVPGRIVVVGVCASGKSVLVDGLRALGYDARCCAQEHSYVPDMWRRLSRPEVLIYLDVSLRALLRRRRRRGVEAMLVQEQHRLRLAREHCDIYLDTETLDEVQVLQRVVAALQALGLEPASVTPSDT